MICKGSGDGSESGLRLGVLCRRSNEETEGEVGISGETGDDVGGP